MIRIRAATIDDAAVITAIYNHGIAERGATFETQPRGIGEVEARVADTRFPLLVALVEGGVVGWAGLGAYRSRDCYAGIAEFSIYLHHEARGRGIGKQLLQALLDAARERGFWKLVSRVFLRNHASRAICRALGFREVGIYEKHGRLDGRWLDVVIVERLIPENLIAESPDPGDSVSEDRTAERVCSEPSAHQASPSKEHQ
jgi:L-amino acid N-acyltransferase YncA